MDHVEGAELVTRLFALMTSKLEDAASEALDGQGRGRESSEQIDRADRIEVAARDIGLIAQAAAAILRLSSHQG